MLSFSIVGPIVSILAILDVILHIHHDLRKLKNNVSSMFSEPSEQINLRIMVCVSFATLLSFGLVLFIIIAWVLSIDEEVMQFMVVIVDPPFVIWISGLLLLCCGIILHGWSRQVRQSFASSWAMSTTHTLVTKGPYSRVRHPSYSSYILCFIGLILMMPSLVTIILLMGIPGYHSISVSEERLLLSHFGNQYKEYMTRTGRFFPFLRT